MPPDQSALDQSAFDRPLTAPCPKCHTEMIYVTSVPHPISPRMRRTTFVCYACNQTRGYSLTPNMADAYAAAAPALAVE